MESFDDLELTEKESQDQIDILMNDPILYGSYKQDRKRDLYKIVLALLSHILLMNGLAYLLGPFIESEGLLSILCASLPLIAVSFILRDRSLKDILSYERKKAEPKDIFFFFGLSLGMNMLLSFLMTLLIEKLGLFVPNITEIIQNMISPSVLVYVVILGPLVEEIFYRGYILQNLKKYGPLPAIILSSIAFALAHLNFEQAFSVLGIAFVLGYVGVIYSFKAAFTIHLLNNLLSMVLSTAMVKLGEDSIILNIIGLVMIVYVLSCLFNFVRSKRFEMKRELSMNKLEKANLKATFSNPMVISMILFYLILIFVLLARQNM